MPLHVYFYFLETVHVLITKNILYEIIGNWTQFAISQQKQQGINLYSAM